MEEQYDLVASGIAGYVGEKAIGYVGNSLGVKDLARFQIDRLRTSGVVILGNNGARVRRFLLDHTFDAGAAGVDTKLLRKYVFLSGNSNIAMRRKVVMANCLLRQAIDPTISVYMRDRYAYARKNELIRPDAPKNLAELVRREIQLGWPEPQEFVAEIASKCGPLLAQRCRPAPFAPLISRRQAVAVQG